jgi:hypothetical protein
MDYRIEKGNFTVEQLALLTVDVISTILDNVVQSARNHWIKIAKEDDSHLKLDYLRGIQPIDVKGRKGTWTVSLVGELPHLLEDGDPELDMRDTLLGPNVPVVPLGNRGKHLSKNKQFYRAIPFRHTGPSSGSVVGQAMGSAYQGMLGIKEAKKLGRKVFKDAKQLSASVTSNIAVHGTIKNPFTGKSITGWRFGGTTKQTWGDRLAEGYAPKLKEHHTTDIYAGMVRMEKPYEKATQSQYMTFRTISTAKRVGWIRKPIEARHYAEKVKLFVDDLIPKAIDAFMKETK